MMREMLRWDPFAELESTLSPEFAFIPRTEIREKDDSYLIAVELPGVKPEDIEVSHAGNRLTISGKREEEERQEGERYHTYERSYGRFTRSFILPEDTAPEDVRAQFNNGVLQVTIPKRPGVQAKRIPVEAGKQEQRQGQEREQPSEKQVKVEKAAA
jgi:HSP20 family protein